jgi:hypothetical protein
MHVLYAKSVRMLNMDVLSQRFDGAFTPHFVGDFPGDVFANAPIKLEQRGVYGSDGAYPHCVDQAKDFGDVGLRGGIGGDSPAKLSSQEPHFIQLVYAMHDVLFGKPRLDILDLTGKFFEGNGRSATHRPLTRIDDCGEKLQVGRHETSKLLEHPIDLKSIRIYSFSSQRLHLIGRGSGRELVAVTAAAVERDHRRNDRMHAFGLSNVIENIPIERSICVKAEVVSQGNPFDCL